MFWSELTAAYYYLLLATSQELQWAICSTYAGLSMGTSEKRHHSCPKEFTWGSYQEMMVRGKTGGGARGEQIKADKWCLGTVTVTHLKLLSAVWLAVSTLHFFIIFTNCWIFCLSVVWIYLYETVLILFWSVWLVFFEITVQFAWQSLRLVL